MPVKFNPFTGQLQIDEKGSGGGSSYIDGEVATYNDLPLDGTAALNSAWLVRTASGVWPVSRKQAGIYIRTATAGSSRDADYTYAGTMPDVFSDAVFTLYDDASTARTGQFNLGSITAGQNRVLTWPDGNGTIARTEDFAAPPAIGSTTRNTGAFTTLNANNGTLTASAPVLDLAQTWNNAATAFTGLRFNVTNTASAATSLLADFQVGGTSRVFIREDGAIRWNVAGPIIRPFSTTVLEFGSGGVSNSVLMSDGWAMNSTTYFGFSDSANAGSTRDVRLFRDAAAVLALRNLANPQTFRIYNTTDAGLTNFERGFMRWSSNVLQIGTEAGGTGAVRHMAFVVGANTYTFFNNGEAVSPLNWVAATTGVFRFNNRARISSPADSVLLIINNAASDFDRLQFGGTTSSFPALKRSSTALQVRLADDSAYSVLDAQLRAQGTAPATSGATGTAGDIRYDADYIYVCTAANTWKRAAIATW